MQTKKNQREKRAKEASEQKVVMVTEVYSVEMGKLVIMGVEYELMKVAQVLRVVMVLESIALAKKVFEVKEVNIQCMRPLKPPINKSLVRLGKTALHGGPE